MRSNADLTAEFDAVDATDGLWPEADFNVAPTKPVRAVVNRAVRREDGSREERPTRQLRVMSWGLIPSWARDRKTQGRMFNARAESVATSNAFKTAYARRRCLVPADGWYEWQQLDGPHGVTKQPRYMVPLDGHCLAFAGLYEFWHDPAGGRDAPTVTSCTILTTDSAGVLAEIHDRMPLVLARDSWARWLDPTVADPADLLTSWDEAAGEHLELRPVSSLVNKVEHNGPDLLAETAAEPEPQRLF